MKALLFVLAMTMVPPGNKKQQLLDVCRTYMPAQYAFLEKYSEESVNQMANGETFREYLLELPTVIHEANHHYNSENAPPINKTRYYYTSGSEKFVVDVFPVFPSSEINALAPDADKKKIFRYNTYITSKTPHLDSRINGIFGLLEEMNAYYHSMKTSLDLFHYLKKQYGFSNGEIWVNWLGSISSYRYSLNEFSIFISWYLQTAKAKHPEVYKRIVNNTQIKTMYRFLHQQNLAMQETYDEYLAETQRELGDAIQVKDGAVFLKKTGGGFGLGNDRLDDTYEILEKPEHQVLEELLK